MGELEDHRRRLGAWYTPPALVAHVVELTLSQAPTGRLTVMDPACGDGRFLAQVARVLRERGTDVDLIGLDIDPGAIASARTCPELADAELMCADALDPYTQWDRRPIDVIVGNPPFLSPLSARVRDDERRRAVPSPAGAYADVAVRFLDRAVRAVRPDGGRVGLVLPLSVLASRDAAAVRRHIAHTTEMRWFWWSPTPVFEATVTTCAVGLERTVRRRTTQRVARTTGLPPVAVRSVASPTTDDTWGELVADTLGVPDVGPISMSGVLGDRAHVTADFRDQYYGIVDALVETRPAEESGMRLVPLVTTAHIDPGRCDWGQRQVRYGKRRWSAPAVDLDALDEVMHAWVASRTVPKVLVATQTKVIEAVADPTGRWLPGVPVISVVPDDGTTVHEIAAVLTSPVPSAHVARRAAGTGLSPHAVRISARHLAEVPWPSGSLSAAVEALHSGAIATCAELVTAAYGVSTETRQRLQEWWLEASRRRRGAEV